MVSIKTYLKLAGALLCVFFGCIAVLMVGSHAVFPVSRYEISASRGERIFENECASCHSLQRGKASYGPSLAGIGIAASQRVPSQSAVQYLVSSIVEPAKFRAPGSVGEMPAGIVNKVSKSDLLSVVAFLLEESDISVSPQSLIAEVSALPRQGGPRRVRTVHIRKLERGRELFFGELQCSQCHSLDNAPGDALLAPNLGRVGLHSEKFIRESICEPSKEVAAGYGNWLLRRGGEVTTGIRLGTPPNEFLVRANTTGPGVEVLVIPDESEIEADSEFELRQSAISSMPSYAGRMPPEDLDALVAFLLMCK